MYHCFLIHSSADGHLGCFHVLPIINSAVMNIGYMCLFQFWFPQCVCPAVGLLSHKAVTQGFLNRSCGQVNCQQPILSPTAVSHFYTTYTWGPSPLSFFPPALPPCIFMYIFIYVYYMVLNSSQLWPLPGFAWCLPLRG